MSAFDPQNSQRPIYLDYNATTPVDEEVVQAMLPYLREEFGNASSNTHPHGENASKAVEEAREQLACLIDASPKELVFTSGATEAVNLAIKGLVQVSDIEQPHILTVTSEHPAVLDTCAVLEEEGVDVEYQPVDANGELNLSELQEKIRPETVLIAVMYANNETGVVHPIAEIGEIAHNSGVYLFCDATQAVGKIEVGKNLPSIDLMSMSGHKFYGPKGVGALYIKDGIELGEQIHGGGHEKGYRSGTLNVPGIVGMGKAAELAHTKYSHEKKRIEELRDKLESSLKTLETVFINGEGASERLPNTTNVRFESVDGEAMLMNLRSSLSLARGSACSSAVPEASHVLKAMGLSEEGANRSFRISLGRFTTEEEIDLCIKSVEDSLQKVKSLPT